MFGFCRIHDQKWNLGCGLECSSLAKQALSICEALGSTFSTKKEKKKIDAKSKKMIFIFKISRLLSQNSRAVTALVPQLRSLPPPSGFLKPLQQGCSATRPPSPQAGDSIPVASTQGSVSMMASISQSSIHLSSIYWSSTHLPIIYYLPVFQ